MGDPSPHEQYRLAVRMADLLLVERDGNSFGARVLECTPDDERHATPELPALPAWTPDEMRDVG